MKLRVAISVATLYFYAEDIFMGYAHIENLYRRPDILDCYALEKIHGTSAHIKFGPGTIIFFAGGESQTNFEALFDKTALLEKFNDKFVDDSLILYGEAFGGKQQGMSETYGKKLRFMVFDVNLNGQWLDVPVAAGLTGEFGLEFVPYERGPLSLPWLDEQRDRPSRVAVVPDKPSEGIVIRPIHELNFKTGDRFIFKHKRAEFRETKTQREVDPNRALLLTEATAIADEWVTPMRLQHVLQKTPYNDVKDTGNVIRAMNEDVKRESEGEITWSKEVASAVGKATVKMLHTISTIQTSTN